MKLHKYSLDDISTGFTYGSMPKEEDLCDNGYPVFSGYRIVGHSTKYNIEKRSLVVVARGVGGTGNVEIAEEKTFLTNLAIAVSIKEEIADLDYLKNYLNTQGLRYLDSGAAQSQITINNLRHHKLFIPSLEVQKKIASVLSAYGNLIEVNNKRIKTLEQMAENLYKEWFVRFRFPGYETAEFENGIPKGWEIKKVKEIVQRLPFGTLYKAEETEQDGRVIVIDQSRDQYVGFHNNDPSHIATPEVPIAIFGDHSCKYQLMIRPFSLSENVVPFVGKNGVHTAYLYYLTHGIIETTEYKRHWTEFMAKKVLIAPALLQKLFVSWVLPIEKVILDISKQSYNLTKQRDLLLPRLMSGKLEIKQ